MADFTDFVLQNARETAAQPSALGQAASAANEGAMLAQRAEQVKAMRAAAIQQQEDLKVAKWDKFGAALATAEKIPEGASRKAFINEYIPNMAKALGIDVNPTSLKMLQGSPSVVKIFADRIRNGQMTLEQALKATNDPEALAPFLGDADIVAAQEALGNASGEFERAAIMRFQEANKTERANALAEGQATRQGNQIAAQAALEAQREANAPKKALATKVADKYADYSAGGGKSAMDSSIRSLEQVSNALQTGQAQTGGITNVIPGFRSDEVQSMLNPRTQELKVQAQGALNSILRQTLGAQFTEAEGARVLNQIWDDKQKPAVNARKIETKVKELRANQRNAEQEFQRFGYLQGQAPTPKTESLTLGDGRTISRAKAQAFLKDHPNDPAAAEIRALLKGGN